LQHWV